MGSFVFVGSGRWKQMKTKKKRRRTSSNENWTRLLKGLNAHQNLLMIQSLPSSARFSFMIKTNAKDDDER